MTGCVNDAQDANCDDGIVCTKDTCAPGEPGADPVTGCINDAQDANCGHPDNVIHRGDVRKHPVIAKKYYPELAARLAEEK